MQKPFDFKHKNHNFRIHHLEESLINEERARSEAKMIVEDYEAIKSPYPPRKEWVFNDLQEMMSFRNKN